MELEADPRPTFVFIGHSAGRTGAPVSLLNIIRWISENTKFECFLILRKGGSLVEEYKKYSTVHIWAPPKKVTPQPKSMAARVRAWLRTTNLRPQCESIDVFEHLKSRKVVSIFNNTGLNGNILAAITSHVSAPVVSRIPELEAYMRKNNTDGSVDKILRLTDRFIAVSGAVKENLTLNHGVEAARISVIYGATAAARVSRGNASLRSKHGLPADAFIVGACGTLDYRKGVDLFIQIANVCLRQMGRRDIYFFWIGAAVSADSLIEYECEIGNLTLKENFFFLGEIEDTAPALAELDVFALTSREDPFPLVMLEAARQGLPIVCFESSGGATEFVDMKIGRAVAMLDTPAFARAIVSLRDCDDLRRELGEAAYSRSLEYGPERMANAVFGVLTNLGGELGEAQSLLQMKTTKTIAKSQPLQ